MPSIIALTEVVVHMEATKTLSLIHIPQVTSSFDHCSARSSLCCTRSPPFPSPPPPPSPPQVEKRVWVQNGLNFDNVGSSLLTLFAMLTAEGWQK